MQVFGIAGWSGSGKTTLLRGLIPLLVGQGVTVSTIKHAHHGFDIDQPGKDSHTHREAGATEVMISSARRWALMHEHRGAAEPGLAEIIRHMTPVDLLLVEGFKHAAYDKLEVHRPALGKPLLALDDPYVVAVAADGPVPGLDRPVLPLDDLPGIARFIRGRAGLPDRLDGAA